MLTPTPSLTPTPLQIDVGVVRRSDAVDPVDDRRLRRAVAEGRWIRVTAGAYVRRPVWDSFTPIERHRLRVQEVRRRLAPGAVVSHFAAAAVSRPVSARSIPARAVEKGGSACRKGQREPIARTPGDHQLTGSALPSS
jgi:hypothetical protein